MLHAKLLGCTERLRTCTMRFGYLQILDVGLGMAGGTEGSWSSCPTLFPGGLRAPSMLSGSVQRKRALAGGFAAHAV